MFVRGHEILGHPLPAVHDFTDVCNAILLLSSFQARDSENSQSILL